MAKLGKRGTGSVPLSMVDSGDITISHMGRGVINAAQPQRRWVKTYLTGATKECGKCRARATLQREVWCGEARWTWYCVHGHTEYLPMDAVHGHARPGGYGKSKEALEVIKSGIAKQLAAESRDRAHQPRAILKRSWQELRLQVNLRRPQ